MKKISWIDRVFWRLQKEQKLHEKELKFQEMKMERRRNQDEEQRTN